MTSPLSNAPDRPRPAPARPEAVVEGPGYRFTVLTSRLIRMEHVADPAAAFTDAATQLVLNRDLGPVPDFQVRRTGVSGEEVLEILTDHLHLRYRPSRGFSRSGLSVTVRSKVLHVYGGTWHFGDAWDPQEPYPTNLGGTARTLDATDGAVTLSPGLLSMSGWAVLDDSASLLLQADQWVRPRPSASPVDGTTPDKDLYLFGYGQDYLAALRDFFRLTGPTPLIDRALLGNWWSRYHPYSEAEYLALMDRFAAEGLPVSVAVVDMDWHEVDIDPSIGNGWTGYTWNRDLFPDPQRFLAALHERGMLVTLNLHPAAGVRRHEEAYAPMARQLGLDPAGGAAIPFNIGDKEVTAAYLAHAHHPREEEGVDFWWLDWQQGGVTDVPGLDPLWMLNHVHYLDSGRERITGSGTARRRPTILSRFADASSHRTPVGFSGDTHATWDSLAFQPVFTATAANIGYYWWSHDIGGHMLGSADPARSARWAQLGCFSPINRLHSSSSAFSSKEPWRYPRDARITMEAYLRLRHRLVPSLYTWARRAHSEGVGVVRPLYHDHPLQVGAYEHLSTFLFGDLVVVPMVHRLDAVTGLGREDAWLPAGAWWDLPTGRRYEAQSPAGRALTFFRPLERVPVLARAGTILPLAGNLSEAAGSNPHHLSVLVVPGADGEFVLEEDDASADPGPGSVVSTRLTTTWSACGVSLHILQRGADSVAPQRRRLTIELLGVRATEGQVRVSLDGRPCGARAVRPRAADGFTLGPGLSVEVGQVEAAALRAGLTVEVSGVLERGADLRGEVFELLDAAQIDYAVKDMAWAAVEAGLKGVELLGALRAAGVPEGLLGAVAEVA
ncbi:TIM-barrel domain-containing protein [Actinomyces oricola]